MIIHHERSVPLRLLARQFGCEPRAGVERKLVERIKAVKNKRARLLLEHILAHGQVTTDELRDLYGYEHPPRAARDVREEGIPIKTRRVKAESGRTIAAYYIDTDSALDADKKGRRAFTKAFKKLLTSHYGTLCGLCSAVFPARALQIDHRIPYEVAGEVEDAKPSEFMLLCASCNRSKSWSCENCSNCKEHKDASKCGACYWASPDEYEHIALDQRRRLTLTWQATETGQYELLKATAKAREQDLGALAKELIVVSLKTQKG